MTEQQENLEREILITTQQLEELIRDNMKYAQNQEAYNQKQQAVIERHNKAKDKLDKVSAEIIEKQARRAAVDQFLKSLRETEKTVKLFSDDMWLNTVDKVLVEIDGTMLFTFKGGTEVRV